MLRAWDSKAKEARTLLGWATLLVALTVFSIFLARANGCSVEDKDGGGGAAPAPTVQCDGLAQGETLVVACPQGPGSRTSVCTAEGMKVAVDQCQAQGDACGGLTTFAAVQPILAKSCKSCHGGYDEYGTAKAKHAEFVRRVKLPRDNQQHMPRGGQLTPAETQAIEKWGRDGFKRPEDCAQTGGGSGAGDVARSFFSADWLRTQILADLTAQPVLDRATTRYLVATHRRNAEADEAEIDQYAKAASKAANSVSDERALAKLPEVAPGVFRVDLDALGLSAADWTAIEDADRLNLEDVSAQGQLIRTLAVARKPWLHVDTFTDTVFRTSALYYQLLGVPATFDELTAQLDVDYADDIADFEAVLFGFNGSPLSTHNRLVSVHESGDGHLWASYDTGPIDAATKNLFSFPLLPDAGGQRNFEFLAGESIFDLPNGLHGYALHNAVAGRLANLAEVAPVNIVRDYLNPAGDRAEIRAGVSCFRCHAAGILPAASGDQIAAHVRRNGSQFAADKDIILALYREDDAQKEIAEANQSYAKALSELGIDANDADPISVAQDRLLLDWDVRKLAAFLFLTEADMEACLFGSAAGAGELGQLLTGGEVSYDQVVQSLPQLRIDCRLFADPIR